MRRVPELDAIRGLAALGVMIYHLNPPAFLFQGIRVDLFLILSGYLVTSIILKRGDAGNFYLVFQARRILRIWPIYYVTLAVLVGANALLAQSRMMDALPNYLTFTQNIQRYWSDSVPPFKWYYVHTWSLALEQQFYLVWPLLLAVAGRRRVVGLSLGLVGLSVTARAVGFHWWLLIARCDGFALGSILAVLFLEGQPGSAVATLDATQRWFGVGVAASLAFLIITLPFSLPWDFDEDMSLWPSLTILGFNLVFFSLIGLVLCFSGHPALRILRDRRLAGLGTISYGLYIYHPLIFLCIARLCAWLGMRDVWWSEGLKIVASTGLAWLSWHYVERPILGLRDYFQYTRARGMGSRAHAHACSLHGVDA